MTIEETNFNLLFDEVFEDRDWLEMQQRGVSSGISVEISNKIFPIKFYTKKRYIDDIEIILGYESFHTISENIVILNSDITLDNINNVISSMISRGTFNRLHQ